MHDSVLIYYPQMGYVQSHVTSLLGILETIQDKDAVAVDN